MGTHVTGTSTTDGGVLSIDDVRGRSVWTEAGDRLGVLRGVETDDAGQIVALDVQRRWILGPHRAVPATGMRFEGGDIVVPTPTDPEFSEHLRRVAEVEADHVAPAPLAPPVLVAGRDGARQRFGGGDMFASMAGALTAVAITLILCTVLFAAFEIALPVTYDTAVSSWSTVLSEPWILGAIALGVASLVGGWTAGRIARFDGVRNGVLAVVWLLVLGAASTIAGSWFGTAYDVALNSGLPQFEATDIAWAGAIGCLVVLAIMLLAGAIGGALGELWHHRADRAMLDVVDVSTGSSTSDFDVTMGPAGSPVAPQRTLYRGGDDLTH